MKKILSKKEAEKLIDEFFLNIKTKTAKEVKKIKKLAMSHNIKLGEKRKLFCKKCCFPYKDSAFKIKNKFKTIICENCKESSKWRIKK